MQAFPPAVPMMILITAQEIHQHASVMDSVTNIGTAAVTLQPVAMLQVMPCNNGNSLPTTDGVAVMVFQSQ